MMCWKTVHATIYKAETICSLLYVCLKVLVVFGKNDNDF